MPATAIQICNGALIKLGARVITSFDDSMKEAELCKERYPRLRDKLLRDHTWNFSKVVVTLTDDGASELFPRWGYVFSVPPDLGRILSVRNVNDDDITYETVQGALHCNFPSIVLRYVANFTDADDGLDFPDDFAEALANLLAAEICISLTQEQSLRQTYYEAFMITVSQARFNGAIEKVQEDDTPVDWLASRQGFSTLDDRSARNLANG